MGPKQGFDDCRIIVYDTTCVTCLKRGKGKRDGRVSAGEKES